ncbi:MAG: copper resistance protein CopC [Acidimicrobiales bacterium]
MTPRRAALRAVLLSLIAIVAWASPAGAHASLTSIDPPDGARLDESPAVVTLTFSEQVSADLGGVRVVAGDGSQVQQGAARVSGSTVEVDLAPDLPDGTYVVSYRVISADGHPVRGASVFGVGAGALDGGALGRVTDEGGDRVWEVAGAVGRGIAYAGVLLAAGGVAFLVLVHRDGPERRRLLRIVWAAALFGAAASMVALPVQAALGTGQGPGSLFDAGVLAEVMRDGVGLGLVLAVAGLVVAVAMVERQPAVALLGAAVAATSFATNGHTRAGSTSTLATIADATHLIVTATWGAALVLLLVCLRQRRGLGPDEQSDTVALVGRVSSLATVTVLLVGVSGVALSWSEVRTLDALTGSGYGRLLIVKVVVVALIAGLGAYNHFRLVPALTRGKVTAALAQLWSTLRLEVLALVVVVALTAVLVVVTPGRTSTEGGVVEEVVSLGDVGTVQLTISPAKAGFNQIHLYLFDPDGRPAEIAESVTLQLSLPAAQLGPITREAVRAGPAHLQLDGDDLAVGGTWTIEIQARVDRFTEANGTVEVQVAG